jgi:4-carboxymuconolactone decarboxylase
MENTLMPASLRVPPIEPGTRPELAALESRILAERGRISLLYQVLLNSEPIASGWERLLTAVRLQTSLPASLRELIILRVAVLNGANYEFEAHVPHAERAGLSSDVIAAVRDPVPGPLFEDTQRTVIDLTDAMTRTVSVPDEVMQRVAQAFDSRETIELVATVAAYNMVSRFLVALGVGH